MCPRSLCPPNGDKLSEDVINEILLRLPVKYIIQCKAVSKQWRSLISNPNFLISHLKLTSSTPKNTLIVHHRKQEESQQDNSSSVSLLDLSCRQLVVTDLNFPYSEGEFPFIPNFKIVGSVSGIVCVCVYIDPPPPIGFGFNSFGVGRFSIYLWNPATKQSKLVPQCSIGDKPTPTVANAFGFDPINDDFKVVMRVGGRALPFTTFVYSTNRNSWRKVEVEQNNSFFVLLKHVCVGGFLCWIHKLMFDIMVFDLHKEAYNCVLKFPVRATASINATITSLHDTIGVLVWERGFDGIINLWKLDDMECLRGGVGASWTRVKSINVDLPVQYVHNYFSSGDLILRCVGNKLLSYKSDKKEANEHPVSVCWLEIFNYTESLVSIPGSKQVNWNAHKDDN